MIATKKRYRVKKEEEYNKLIKQAPWIKNKYFVIYYQKNHLPYDRFGISVGRKLGKAVLRNKYKRRIRNILDIYRKDYVNYEDYIIILRSRALSLKFNELEKELLSLLKRRRKNGKEKKEMDNHISTTNTFNRLYKDTHR